MKVSTESRYGLRATMHLAQAQGRPVTSASIAAGQAVSKKYLDNILGRLVRAGLVRSHRGPGGGYVLARDARQITVLDVVRTLERNFALVPCTRRPAACARSTGCLARTVWCRLAASIERTLDAIPLSELAKPARRPRPRGRPVSKRSSNGRRQP